MPDDKRAPLPMTTPVLSSSALSSIADDLRQRDPDRFFTSLLAPAEYRDDLMALYALDAELRQIRALVSEPMLGRIRLQWWYERIAALQTGEEQPSGPPLMYAMDALIHRTPMPENRFCDYFCGRSNDMEEAPILDTSFFQQYTQGVGGSLAVLAYRVLGGDFDHPAAEAARLSGAVWETAYVLRSVLTHSQKGIMMLPLADLPEAILSASDIDSPEAVRSLGPLMIQLAQQGLDQARQARALCQRPPGQTLAAFLPMVIAEAWLTRLVRNGGDLLDARLTLPHRRPLVMLWRRLRGIY